jgi:hypothetical protein
MEQQCNSPLPQCLIVDTEPSPRRTYRALGYSPRTAQNLADFGQTGAPALQLPNGSLPSKYLLQKFRDNDHKLVKRKQAAKKQPERKARQGQSTGSGRLPQTSTGLGTKYELYSSINGVVVAVYCC